MASDYLICNDIWSRECSLEEFVHSALPIDNLVSISGLIRTENAREFHVYFSYKPRPHIQVLCDDPNFCGSEQYFDTVTRIFRSIDTAQGNKESNDMQPPKSIPDIGAAVKNIFEEFKKPERFQNVIVLYRAVEQIKSPNPNA